MQFGVELNTRKSHSDNRNSQRLLDSQLQSKLLNGNSNRNWYLLNWRDDLSIATAARICFCDWRRIYLFAWIYNLICCRLYSWRRHHIYLHRKNLIWRIIYILIFLWRTAHDWMSNSELVWELNSFEFIYCVKFNFICMFYKFNY